MTRLQPARDLPIGATIAWLLMGAAISWIGVPVEHQLLWAANALPVASIVLYPRAALWQCLLLVAAMAGQAWFYGTLSTSVMPGVATLIEVVLAGRLIRRWAPTIADLDEPFTVFRFVAAVAGAVLAAALFMVLMAAPRSTPQSAALLGNWLLPQSCGLLVMLPVLLVFFPGPISRVGRSIGVGLAGDLAVIATVAVSAAVFGQSNNGLWFITIPALLLATLRLRAIGAAGAITVLALAGWTLTLGQSPHGAVPEPLRPDLALLQLLLITMTISAQLLVATLAAGDRLAGQMRVLALLSEQVNEIVFQADRAGRWTYLNHAFETATGYSRQHMIGTPITAMIDANDRDRAVATLAELMGGTRQDARLDVAMRHADGSLHRAELVLTRISDQASDADRIGGIWHDVTDRFHEKAALRAETAQAQAAADRDEITGVANRRHFQRNLAQGVAEARSRAAPLSLAMLDVDHFKRINDTHGHPAGDLVLREIATLARDLVRTNDLVARIGGDEFAIVLPNAPAAAALDIARRLLTRIAASPLQLRFPALSVSIGVAQLADGGDADGLLAAADRALYAAKRKGRNRAEIDNDD